MNFSETYAELDFDRIATRIAGEDAFLYGTRPRDRDDAPRLNPAGARPGPAEVDEILGRFEQGLAPEDLIVLLSPAAGARLEELAARAQYLTRKRFGRVMQLYAPLYLSNECRSTCTYCGFSYENDIRRKTLRRDEIAREGDLLHAAGHRQVLLLTGEEHLRAPVDYLAEAADVLAERFPSIAIEVYPLKAEDYERLSAHGVDGLAVYQETYDPVRYRQVHLRGQKKKLEYRLDCPDRAGRAGLRRIAIGALLGLSDPAAEVYCAALHARYLMKNYWSTQISVSLPRLRAAAGFKNAPELPDALYLQYLCALRLFLPDAGIILSTRESPRLRDALAPICITHMSAGSRTEPGGYSDSGATEQFQIEDLRSVPEITAMLEGLALEPVFLDWNVRAL